MKAKKLFALLLTGAMVLTVGATSACTNKPDPKPTPGPSGGGDYTVDTTEYYLVGDGAGDLKKNGWSNTNHTLVMTRDESADHNVFNITIDMYADDVFQIVHDDSWDGQMGIDFFYGVEEDDDLGYVSKNEDDNVVFAGSGMFGKDVTLQKGHDGTYTISLHTFPDDSTKTSYITWTKDGELSALLDMYVVSDMNDFGFQQNAYNASHMTKKNDTIWKAIVEIKENDLVRDENGDEVTTGAQYAAVAVRNDVADETGYKAVTHDKNDKWKSTVINGDEYNLLPAGAYTFYYDTEKGTLTIEEGAVEIYFVGSFNGWADGATAQWKLTEDADDNWTGYLSIAEGTAEAKLYNPYMNGWYSPDGNNIQLTAGDYFFKFTTKTETVEYEKMAYYIVGSVPNQDGEADDNYNFKIGEYSSIPLFEGETEGVYEITFPVPDTSTAYDWVKPNVFAFKVVYGTFLGGARDWYGDGDNNVFIPEVGEYTISFNTETNEVKAVRTVKTVTFNLNYAGATGAPEALKVESGKTAAVPTEPTRTGYTFYGWYENEECTIKYDFDTEVYDDITLYARWIADTDIPASVKVTFDLNYEGAPAAEQKDTVKGLVEEPAAPTRTGYYFIGWYDAASDGNYFNFDALVSSATTVYAHWLEIDTHVYHIVGNLKSGAIGEWNPADESLALVKDTRYPNSNVFTITLTLFAGDLFKIKGVTNWDDGYEVNSGALMYYAELGDDYGNIKVNVDGVYTLTFYRDSWMLDYTVKPIVTKDEVCFKVNGVEGEKLSNSGDIWSGYVTVEAGDTVKLVNKADYAEYDVNVTEAGEYFVMLNIEDGTVEFEKCAYWVVGTFVDASGKVQNFVLVEGLTPKMALGADGKYTATVAVTDVTSVSGLEWIVSEGEPGSIFAIQVVYGTNLGGVKDWVGGGNSWATSGAGTYTVTFEADTRTTTFTKNA